MTNPEFFKQSTYNILYYKYREFFFSGGTILACLLIGILVIIPQINTVLSRQDAVNTTRTEIETLRKNVTVLTSLKSSDLALDLTEVNTALPQNKDFGSIVEAVQRAAGVSHVIVGDYSLQIGELGGKKPAGKNTTVQLGITVTGDPAGVTQLVRTITHQLPLADVVGVQGNQKSAAVSLVFYYQPLPTVNVNTTDPITSLSSIDLQTLKTLDDFKVK